jgi:hypothetical protein
MLLWRTGKIIVGRFEIQIEQSWEIMEFGETFGCETADSTTSGASLLMILTFFNIERSGVLFPGVFRFIIVIREGTNHGRLDVVVLRVSKL